MKSYNLHGINNIRFEEADKPVPNTDEVLVKVMAAGVCGSDIPRIYKTGAHVHPIIPGHEFAGIIDSVADERDSHLVGKRVGNFPLIPCMDCSQCKVKKYEMCRHYNYLGSRCDGGFAEYVKVPKWNLIELPDNVTYEQAALLEPLSVATHAMRNLLGQETNKDKSIIVWGIGTIGLMLVSILKAEGFNNITCVGNKQFQLEKAIKEIGIDSNQALLQSDDIKEKLQKISEEGFEYLFECVGKSETAEMVVDEAAPSGQIMFVGNPYSDMTFSKNVYWKILRNQLTIKGTWNSSYTKEETDDWHYVLNLLSSEKLKTDYMITHRYSLDKLVDGLELMRDKREDYIKIMYVG